MQIINFQNDSYFFKNKSLQRSYNEHLSTSFGMKKVLINFQNPQSTNISHSMSL